jgi:uncharacterized membrane protein
MATVTRRKPAREAASRGGAQRGNVRIVRAITIRRPAAELYAFWRQFENIPRVIRHPVTIRTQSPTESHWSVSAPGGRRVEWDAEVTEDRPNEKIAWRSRAGADVPNNGAVEFTPAPGGDGTEVRVELEYDPPGGKLAAWLAKVTGKEGAQQVEDTLRRFKALLEAGEIPTIDGQSVGGPQAPRKGKK